jgi:hypothetical protein
VSCDANGTNVSTLIFCESTITLVDVCGAPVEVTVNDALVTGQPALNDDII